MNRVTNTVYYAMQGVAIFFAVLSMFFLIPALTLLAIADSVSRCVNFVTEREEVGGLETGILNSMRKQARKEEEKS